MILHGDCLELMNGIPDGSIDMTVTSPPYDNLRTYNGTLDWGEHVWMPVVRELYRVTKHGGVVVWVVGDATIKGSETGTSFRQALYFKEIGFNLHDTMIYTRMQIKFNRFGHKKYPNAFDYMFVFTKGKMSPTVRSENGELKKSHSFGREYKEFGSRNNVWNYFTGGHNSTKYKEAFKHPAIFPEKLAIDHILSWSNEGDTILDPFAGSGTTAIACINTNRKYICMEKDVEYFEIMRERVERRKASGDLFAF